MLNRVWVILGMLVCQVLGEIPYAVANTSTSTAKQDTSNIIEIRAFLIPTNQATISSHIAAKIEKIFVREGDFFRKGDPLFSFDNALQEATYKRALAEYDAAAKTYEAQSKLALYDSVSSVELSVAKSNLDKTKAEYAYAKEQLEKCEVLAPYNGYVYKIRVNTHETLTAGQPMIEIIGREHLKIQLLIPSNWIRWVKKGTPFILHIDDTNHDYYAEISTILPKVDSLVQSVEAHGIFQKPYGDLIPGMSGGAYFTVPHES